MSQFPRRANTAGRLRRRGRIGVETWYVLMVVLSFATAGAWAFRQLHEAESPWLGVFWGACSAIAVPVYYFGLPFVLAWLIGLFSPSRPAERDDATANDLREQRKATIFYYCMIAIMIPPPIVLVAWLVWRLAA